MEYTKIMRPILTFVLMLSLLAGCQQPVEAMNVIKIEKAVTNTSEVTIVPKANTSSVSLQTLSIARNPVVSTVPATSGGDVCQLIKENGKYYTIQCKRNGNGIKASVGNIRSICWACGLTVDPDGTIVNAGSASDSGIFVSSVTKVDTSAYADEVLRLINEERTRAGLDELVEDSYLSEVARERSEEIIIDFSHTRPDGTTVVDLGLGENCHYGRNNPQAAVEAWMNSAGHKANILNEKYVSFGAGCYQGETSQIFYVVTFRKS